jgi:hypothetical protein
MLHMSKDSRKYCVICPTATKLLLKINFLLCPCSNSVFIIYAIKCNLQNKEKLNTKYE